MTAFYLTSLTVTQKLHSLELLLLTKKILNIVKALDIRKAHGCVDASIKIVKLCDQSIISRLSIIFRNLIATATFTDTWKKLNIVPVHKNWADSWELQFVLNLVPSASFRYKRKAKKRPWNTSKHVIKICQNRGHIFSE